MRDYKWLHEYCLNRFGGPAELEARLPQPRSAEALRALGDDRYLAPDLAAAARLIGTGTLAQASGLALPELSA